MAVLSTDGASVFVSITEFFRRWGIRHRVYSAYYPRSKWVEVGVKCAKRLITANFGPGGTLDKDSVARALLHRNYPDPITNLSPAQIIFGRNLKDHLPGQHSQYQPRPEWHQQTEAREKFLAQRHARMADRLQMGAKKLSVLSCWDHVAIQEQTSPVKVGHWTKT